MKNVHKKILSAIMSFVLMLTMTGGFSIIAQAATIAAGTASGTQGYDSISVCLTEGDFSSAEDDVVNVANWTLTASGGQTITNINKGDSKYVALYLSSVIGPGDTFQLQAAAGVFEAGTDPFMPMDVDITVPIPATGTATATAGTKDIEITLSSGTFSPSTSTVQMVGLWTLGGASAAANPITGVTYTDAATTRTHVTITLTDNINIDDTYTISASQGVFVNVAVAPFASPLPVMVQSEVCQIDSTGYTTLDDALNSVPAGGATATTIKLLQDIDYAGGITVANKKIIFDLNGKTLSIDNTTGTGLTVTTGSEIDITNPGAFNVTGSERGLSASNSIVKVTNVNSNTLHGINASNNSDITVTNDVTSSSYMAVAASGGSMINIGGNASGANYGVYAQDAGTAVTVEGNVSAAGNNSCGVHSRGGAAVTVYGNVTATGSNNSGANLSTGGTLTIDGMITAQGYVMFGMVAKTAADITTPTTKAGYFTYTDDISTVWVKVPSVPSGVCEIDGMQYASLDDALGMVGGGMTKTIRLLDDIAYNNGISISGGQNITFNLDGHVLTVSSSTGIGLLVTNGHVGYIGSGAFNVTGTILGVSANGGSASATVTTATAADDEGTGASAYNGGDIIVNGSVQGGAHGAAAGIVGSTVVVNGDATGTTAFDGSGATAGSGGHVTINGGTAQGVMYGAYANGSDSLVTITGGDAIGTGPNSFGVHAEIDGTINVTGNVQGTRYGVYSSDGTSVVVTGNAAVTADVNGWGVNAQSGGTIEIGGNVTANGSSLGAFVTSGGEITIEGAISATNYISIFDDISEVFVYKDGSEGSRTIPSTKVGYFTYSAGTSTVWVKEASPIVSAAISPATTTFDKNPANQADVSTTITWNDAVSVSNVKNAGISVGAADYTVSGNTLTINKEYLALQPVGSLVLTIEFDKGNTTELTIVISDTTPPIGNNPPTWPEGSTLTAVGTTKTKTVLNWTAAVDDAGVTGYRIYKDNSLIQTVTGAVYGYEVTGLHSSTSYIFRIQAGDADSNWTYGPTVTVRTKSSGGGGGSFTPSPSPEPKPVAQVLDSNENVTKTLSVRTDKITGTVSLDVDSASLAAAFDRSKADDKGVKTVKIDIPKTDGAKAYEPILPVSFLASGDVMKAVELKTAIASVKVPGNMLTAANAAGAQNVSLTIALTDKSKLSEEVQAQIGSRPVIELSMSIDGKQTPWSNEGAPVTVTIPYTPSEEELKAPEHITVWYIDGSGKTISVPSGRYDPATGKVTFITTHFSNYAVVYVTKTFEDLGSVAWAKKAIGVLASKGIIRGISEEKYAPITNITRADFLYYLIRTFGVDAKIDGNFNDINSDAYYYKEIGIAKKLGITTGVGNNQFIPDASITRQDMMVLTTRALKKFKELKAISDITVLDKFSDKGDIAGYAAESMATLVKEGLIIGSGDKLNPHSLTNRAEAAVFLYRIYLLGLW